MVSINRKLANIGGSFDSGQPGDFLTLNDSGDGLFRDIQWTEIANRPNVLDSTDINAIINTAVTNVIDNAPANLDTLNELAAALNDDPNFAATVTSLINALPDSSEVSSIISATVTQAMVNALNVNADTLNSQDGSYYLDYTNFTNTPSVTDSAAVATVVTKAFVDALNINADTLDGQQGTYYLDYTNFTNTPNVLDSADVTALVNTGVANVIGAAPASLDTLNELAAAINDDASFATTVTNQVNALPDSAQVSGIITADVDKAFIDALNVDADTLDGQQGTYYLDYTNFTNTPNVLDSADILNIVDSAYVTNIVDSAHFQVIVDSAYVNARASAASGFVKYKYTTTSAQTDITDSDDNGNVLSYQQNGIMVWYNGVLLKSGTDYTATDGSTVTLTTGASAGDNVVIGKWAIPTSGGGGAGGFYLANATYALGAGGQGSIQEDTIDYVSISTGGTASDFGNLISPSNPVTNCSDASRAVMSKNFDNSAVAADRVEYVTISTPGNATDFGVLTDTRHYEAALGDGTYGYFAGGNSAGKIIDYVTIQTAGNATDYGDMFVARRATYATCDGTYGVTAGGYMVTSPFTAGSVDIQYFSTGSPSNASDFGDLLVGMHQSDGGACDGTYGVFAGGREVGGNTAINNIQYITIQTPSDASDFGDLVIATRNNAGTGDGTTGLFLAGNQNPNSMTTQIDKVTVATPGNSTDFGDLTVARQDLGACAGT